MFMKKWNSNDMKKEVESRAETIDFKTEDLNAPEEADGTVDLKVVDF